VITHESAKALLKLAIETPPEQTWPPTFGAIVQGTERASYVAHALITLGVAFSCEHLDGDRVEITVEREYREVLGQAVVATEGVEPR
jgi:hypothetical protein